MDSNHRSRSCDKVSLLLPMRDAGPISWMGLLSTGRLARRRWSAAGPLSTAVSFSAGPMVRIRFSPAVSRQTIGSSAAEQPANAASDHEFVGDPAYIHLEIEALHRRAREMPRQTARTGSA